MVNKSAPEKPPTLGPDLVYERVMLKRAAAQLGKPVRAIGSFRLATLQPDPPARTQQLALFSGRFGTHLFLLLCASILSLPAAVASFLYYAGTQSLLGAAIVFPIAAVASAFLVLFMFGLVNFILERIRYIRRRSDPQILDFALRDAPFLAVTDTDVHFLSQRVIRDGLNPTPLPRLLRDLTSWPLPSLRLRGDEEGVLEFRLAGGVRWYRIEPAGPSGCLSDAACLKAFRLVREATLNRQEL